MRHTEQVRLLKRVLHLVDEDRCDMVAHEHELPVTAYTDPERLAAEQRHLFRGRPLILARSEQLPEAGDYLTHDSSGLPLLIVRGDDGEIRVLLNVCRHRGARVVAAGDGNRRRFACPYHAWTYDRAGALCRAPDAEGFPRAMRARLGLTRLPAAERHGFVWAILDPAAAERDLAAELPAFLGQLDEDWTSFGLARHVHYAPASFSLAMNWKLAIDIFLEAYHVRYVHTRSIYPIFFDNIGLFERHGPHQRNLFPKRTVPDLAQRPEGEWRLREHSNVLYHLFPNTLALVQPDHVSVFHVHPDGSAACAVDAYTLLPEPPANDKARDYWRKNIDILHTAIREDFVMGESIQAGLTSGANEVVRFGRYEQSLAWFHDAVAAAVQPPPAAVRDAAARG